MKLEQVKKKLHTNVIISLTNGNNYEGFTQDILYPNDDEDIKEPLLLLKLKGKSNRLIHGFPIRDIKSIKDN